MVYLINHQLPVAVPSIIFTLILHVCTQYYFDKKDRAAGIITQSSSTLSDEKVKRAEKIPGYYALLPLVPLVLLFTFNKLVYKTIVLDVATAMFIGWVFAIFVDLATRRDLVAVFKDGAAMFQGMGHMLTSVVGLIFVAALFAAGLQNTGLVSLLIEAAKGAGMGMAGTGIVVSIVIGIVTVLTGSGVASFTGLVPIAPAVAAGEYLRPISPVAGVVIIVAGFANVSPLAVVRRNLIPCVGGLVFSLAMTIFMML